MKKYVIIAVFVGFMIWAVSTNAKTVAPPPSIAQGNVTLGDTFTINGKVYNTEDY